MKRLLIELPELQSIVGSGELGHVTKVVGEEDPQLGVIGKTVFKSGDREVLVVTPADTNRRSWLIYTDKDAEPVEDIYLRFHAK